MGDPYVVHLLGGFVPDVRRIADTVGLAVAPFWEWVAGRLLGVHTSSFRTWLDLCMFHRSDRCLGIHPLDSRDLSVVL